MTPGDEDEYQSQERSLIPGKTRDREFLDLPETQRTSIARIVGVAKASYIVEMSSGFDQRLNVPFYQPPKKLPHPCR
jgi:hypothetical protein